MYRSKWFSCNGGFILSSFHEFISRDSFQGRFNFIPRLAILPTARSTGTTGASLTFSCLLDEANPSVTCSGKDPVGNALPLDVGDQPKLILDHSVGILWTVTEIETWFCHILPSLAIVATSCEDWMNTTLLTMFNFMGWGVVRVWVWVGQFSSLWKIWSFGWRNLQYMVHMELLQNWQDAWKECHYHLQLRHVQSCLCSKFQCFPVCFVLNIHAIVNPPKNN